MMDKALNSKKRSTKISTNNGAEDSVKLVVGSEEWCELKSLGVPAIKARVDSGAKTSALHAFNIQPFSREGLPWVSFDLHPIQNNRRVSVTCEAPVIDRRLVKSSSGVVEKRYVVKSDVVIANHCWAIELTLTNRDSMGFRMLLGREAMSGRLLVDPAASHCLGEVTESKLRRLYGDNESSSGGLRIGVLASDPALYSNKRLLEVGEERGHEMVFLNINQCYIKLDADEPEVHSRGGRILNDMDAIIPRIRPSVTFYGCALVRQFESLGVYTLNSSSAITQSRDKLYALQLLLKSGLDIPTTGFANSPMDTNDLIDMVGGAPLIIKLLDGAQGSGVVLAETRKAAESVVNAMKSLKANLLVQQFVKEAAGRDIRCFVIDGKIAASIERKAAPGEFRANLHQGGSAFLVKVTPDEKRLVLKAVKTLGLRVAGVDIIRSNAGPLLLEVNSSPGLEGIEMATGKDIAGAMIAAIERKLDWRRERAVKRKSRKRQIS